MKELSSTRLAEGLGTSAAPRILDVRLADDYEAARIPGSLNNCVFEVAFHERLPQSSPDKNQPLIIVGSSSRSMEASMACEKLERAGYSDVAVLSGGLEAWQSQGHPLEHGAPLGPEPEAPHGRLDLDLDECRLEWLGRNLINKHSGTVDITSGFLDFKDGHLTGGEFTFDFSTLKCSDLAGSDLHEVLIRHLQDHDFLDFERYPEGRLVVSGSREVPGATPGSPNLQIHADLTLRGISRPIEFLATAGPGPHGKPAAQAAFSIDRTRWNIIYGSGRFFDRIAGHLVNDLVDFQVRILCK